MTESKEVPGGYKRVGATLHFEIVDLEAVFDFGRLADHGLTDELLASGTRADRIVASGALQHRGLYTKKLVGISGTGGAKSASPAREIAVVFRRVSSKKRADLWRLYSEEPPAYYNDPSSFLDVHHEGFHSAAILYRSPEPDHEFGSPSGSWELYCSLPEQLFDLLCAEVLAERCRRINLDVDFNELLIPLADSLTGYLDTYYVPERHRSIDEPNGGWVVRVSWSSKSPVVAGDKAVVGDNCEKASDETQSLGLNTEEWHQPLLSEVRAIRAHVSRIAWWLVAVIVWSLLLLSW